MWPENNIYLWQRYCLSCQSLSRTHLNSVYTVLKKNRAAMEGYILKICGLAFTNDNVSARVNAFGPLAFCGRYITLHHQREALVNMLQDVSFPTGWPVQPIIEDLNDSG
ncbi:uncharacterized protein K444DRAFT_166965 [Hyaloscypha bicolor E]|uniref:Uncharacterized protein n=1 Tax=Hyaloscypha bicolor E TaxID=1095630 RepID=A0A2J6TTA4_9HELO|nr:uncharacterized protein K444DRAFT_166965 [Hyaloscypha bicolor E]PMD66235.1 hypothetical protein K444DRAFT_166965 [Hyaloscypha bicolor E]